MQDPRRNYGTEQAPACVFAPVPQAKTKHVMVSLG
jgi:hypothetical protein